MSHRGRAHRWGVSAYKGGFAVLLSMWVRLWGGWYVYRERARPGKPLARLHRPIYKAFMDSRGAYVSLLTEFAGEK